MSDIAEALTHNFGYGEIPAHRHVNPDGSQGGWVADTARVAANVTVPDDASVGYGASVGYRASVGDGASVGNGASVGYRASVGDDASVGNGASVGYRASVGGAQPNFDRLLALRELIGREHADGAWKVAAGDVVGLNMNSWVGKENACGMTACVGGSLAMDPATPLVTLTKSNMPFYECATGYFAIGLYLGLTYEETMTLCSPDRYLDCNDIDEVVRRIDALLGDRAPQEAAT